MQNQVETSMNVHPETSTLTGTLYFDKVSYIDSNQTDLDEDQVCYFHWL